MKRKNNIFHGGSESPLDRNISRLMKLADDSGQPSRAFTRSLIDDAMNELDRSEAEVNHNHSKTTVIISQWEKAAAMIAVICGAGFGLFVSIMAHLSSGFAAVILIAMFVNQLIYYGGLIL
jgi:hypothetical protein